MHAGAPPHEDARCPRPLREPETCAPGRPLTAAERAGRPSLGHDRGRRIPVDQPRGSARPVLSSPRDGAYRCGRQQASRTTRRFFARTCAGMAAATGTAVADRRTPAATVVPLPDSVACLRSPCTFPGTSFAHLQPVARTATQCRPLPRQPPRRLRGVATPATVPGTRHAQHPGGDENPLQRPGLDMRRDARTHSLERDRCTDITRISQRFQLIRSACPLMIDEQHREPDGPSRRASAAERSPR
jgi:hypothetical protein